MTTQPWFECGDAVNRYDVGLVYSDMARFGQEEMVPRYPEELTRDLQCWTNYAHCASLVRRETQEMRGALEVPVHPKEGHEDWLAWRRILEQGWKARKQTALYRFRRHTGGASLKNAWGLDDLQGNLPPHGPFLLGQEYHHEAPLADLFQQFVRPDERSRSLADGVVGRGSVRRWTTQEVVNFAMSL